mmetsp:Transcript_27362/g.109575  ORF Transcript_27362/g.109575 Transcript_27362/m.109575 type:complete len:95 (+) Transcript_27362:1082-1366(+)
MLFELASESAHHHHGPLSAPSSYEKTLSDPSSYRSISLDSPFVQRAVVTSVSLSSAFSRGACVVYRRVVHRVVSSSRPVVVVPHSACLVRWYNN